MKWESPYSINTTADPDAVRAKVRRESWTKRILGVAVILGSALAFYFYVIAPHLHQ